MPLLDFHSQLEMTHPALKPGLVASVLADATIQPGPLPISSRGDLAGALQRAAAALDTVTVSVSAPSCPQ